MRRLSQARLLPYEQGKPFGLRASSGPTISTINARLLTPDHPQFSLGEPYDVNKHTAELSRQVGLHDPYVICNGAERWSVEWEGSDDLILRRKLGFFIVIDCGRGREHILCDDCGWTGKERSRSQRRFMVSDIAFRHHH